MFSCKCFGCRDRATAIAVGTDGIGTWTVKPFCASTIIAYKTLTFKAPSRRVPYSNDFVPNPRCVQSSLFEIAVVNRRQSYTLYPSKCTDLPVTTFVCSPSIPPFLKIPKGKMPALPISQPSDWNNNVYVLATTRVFVMIGLAYLLRTLYSLVPSIWGARSASVSAGGLSFPCRFDLCTRVI